jgi:hypothetical protein
MKIDKSLFLLVTGTIAGTACSFNISSNNPGTTPSATPQATAPATAPPGPAGPGPRHLSGHTLGLKGTPLDLGDGGAAPPPAPTPPPAAACLDNGASTAIDCTTMTDKSCGWAKKRCDAFTQYLNPKVANQAATCATQAKDACSGSAVTCTQTAMKSACADPQVAQVCAQMAATCKDTVDNCTAILSSLNAAGRQQAATACASAASCSAGIAACVDKALFPAAEGAGAARPTR